MVQDAKDCIVQATGAIINFLSAMLQVTFTQVASLGV